MKIILFELIKSDGSSASFTMASQRGSSVQLRAKALLVSYCLNTPTHGLAYCVSSRNIAEKVFWILAVLVSLTSGFFLATKVSIQDL